jgi:hypothetical protein
MGWLIGGIIAVAVVVIVIATWPLSLVGLIGLGLWYWRRQKANDVPPDLAITCGPFTPPPLTPIEITRAELHEDEVRPYGGCTIGDEDPWTKTGGSLSPVSGPLPTTAAEPRRNRGDR